MVGDGTYFLPLPPAAVFGAPLGLEMAGGNGNYLAFFFLLNRAGRAVLLMLSPLAGSIWVDVGVLWGLAEI